MTLEQDRDRKRIAFTKDVVPLIAKYLGEDPSLNDYEALVVALQEMSEDLNMIENNLITLADLRGPGLYLIDAGGSRRVVGVNVGRPEIANAMRSSLSGVFRFTRSTVITSWYSSCGRFIVILLGYFTPLKSW